MDTKIGTDNTINTIDTVDIEDIDVTDIEVLKPKPKIKIVIKKKPVQAPIVLKPTPNVVRVKPVVVEVPKPIKIVKSQIISASRRTDIPAQYMDHMVKSMYGGTIEVTSPYGQKSIVSLSSNDVKLIAWWSKDYHNWLIQYNLHKDLFSQYAHMFNFTLTGDEVLEPGVKSTLPERISQLQQLCSLFGPKSIKLRFDPIVIYYDKKDTNTIVHNNLQHFDEITTVAHDLGIKNIIFAFCITYTKVIQRMARHGKTVVQMNTAEQKKVLDELIDICQSKDITLQTCSNSELIGYRGIGVSSCIDGKIANELCGGKLKSIKKDKGQRDQCTCVESRDVGSYSMKCSHKCRFCYANPSS